MPLLLLSGRRAPTGWVWQAEGHQSSLPLQHIMAGKQVEVGGGVGWQVGWGGETGGGCRSFV